MMVNTVTISFKIIEPMMFRGPGELDPFVKGTYSRVTTLNMPSPSTVAGTLASYFISELGTYIPSAGGWIDQYLTILGSDIKIRGPLIKLNCELMVEDRLFKGFLNMEKIKQKCEKEWEKLQQKLNSLKQLDEYLKMIEFEPSVKIEKDVRVGVMLQMREKNTEIIPMKSVKEGFLYSTEYIDYKKAKDKEAYVEIITEIKGELIKKLSSARQLPVKFGGESRVALFSFRQGEEILNEIKAQLWEEKQQHHGFLALYLATPALFKGGKRVKDHINDWIKSMNYRLVGVSGESFVLGAGFILKEQKRKPIYTSLNPGSIIFLEGEFDLLKIYWDSMLGEASMLGYGTLIPVPI